MASTGKRNPKAISKTALDSLDAKLSVMHAAWLRDDSFVVSDGDAARSSPIHVYTQLLQRLHHGLAPGHPRRRQSPLVNAGYAARMAVMTYILERWINGVVGSWSEYTVKPSAEREKNMGLVDFRRINVVVIGCGMDALGIWSKDLLQRSLCAVISKSGANGHESFSSPNINVYEFDVWDNCVLKQKSLLRSGLINLSSIVNKEKMNTDDELDIQNSYHIHVRGRLNLDGSGSTNAESDYTLVSTDLRQVDRSLDKMKQHKSILSHVGLKAGLDPSQPTIILSELVLAYLGYEAANAVMYSISNDMISGNTLSTFVCLEPMFPTGNNNTSRGIASIQESYGIDYSRQFHGKLLTGNSNSTTRTNDDSRHSLWLHPLGSNRHTVRLRLESCGISCFSIATLREYAIHVASTLRKEKNSSSQNGQVKTIGPKFLCAKEPFDEHAALSLSLDCYCVASVFHPLSAIRGQNIAGNNELQNWMNDICPWPIESAIGRTFRIKPISTSAEDAQVNDLYKKLYVHLYDEYPAIKKLVKSALKGDFLVDQTSIKSSGDETVSVIRDRFVKEGGDFWVATTDNSPSSNDTIERSHTFVVGCIGVKRRGIKNEYCDEDDRQKLTEFEIHRFAVDENHRGTGIGKKLIEVAETSIIAGLSRINRATTLYAVTPLCLTAARKLYESCGYCDNELDSFSAGALRMKVYSKSIGEGSTWRTCGRLT